MEKFFHNKRELIFWGIGIIIFSVITVYSIYAISFIARRAQEAFGGSLKGGEEIIKFNLEKARQLKR